MNGRDKPELNNRLQKAEFFVGRSKKVLMDDSSILTDPASVIQCELSR